MDFIADIIRTNLGSYLAEKIGDTTISEEDIKSYIDQWLAVQNVSKQPVKSKTPSVKKDVQNNDDNMMYDNPPLLSKTEYEKMKVADLKAICKKMGISGPLGTKASIIAKILGESDSPVHKKKDTTEKVKPQKVPVIKPTPKVIEFIQQDVIDLVVDNFGHTIHEESGLIFDTSNKVIGRSAPDGSIMRLDKKDIETCNKYNFEYAIHSDFEFEDEEDELNG